MKKIFTLVMALALITIALSAPALADTRRTAPATEPITYVGDYDGDGRVGVADAVAIARQVNSGAFDTLDGTEEAWNNFFFGPNLWRVGFWCDMNNDYRIDTRDIILMMRTAIGLIEPVVFVPNYPV